MKSLLLLATGIVLLSATTPGQAQTDTKPNPDAAVHPHNYKHPGSAAMRSVRGIEFKEKYRRAQSVADFKEQQRRGGQLEATIAVPARDVAVSESRNYKQQNLNVKSRKKETSRAAEPTSGNL